jgi:ring-1,2-phenylacetyl-CoA epoxidase subunit PaaD
MDAARLSGGHMVAGRPDIGEIRSWLDEVPDPEIPAISLNDLGIIRDLRWEGDTLEVTITPTYSGCPATSVINMEIEAALRKNGIEKIQLKRQLFPPWTTDWISKEAHAKLEAYGIAPPSGAKGPDRCPHCGSNALERISQFGSTPCKAQWRCKSCLEPFDFFKCI